MVKSPEPDPPPGVTRWLISCDDTGLHGSPYFGFGTLWMAWQRRGDFQEWIREIRAAHPEHQHSEFKWQHVNKRTLATYKDLASLFFKRAPLAFHCLLVKKADVDKTLHGGDMDLARRKFMTKLITCKVEHLLRAHPERQQTFRVWADPINSRYPKAAEVVEIVANNVIAGSQKKPCLEPVMDGVLEHDSKDTPSIQLCDVLLGAAAAPWQQECSSDAKLELQKFIAGHLGWNDLHADTFRTERKWNAWVFFDPTKQRRRAASRAVILKYPLPSKSRAA
jgi:hypothetical protein